MSEALISAKAQLEAGKAILREQRDEMASTSHLATAKTVFKKGVALAKAALNDAKKEADANKIAAATEVMSQLKAAFRNVREDSQNCNHTAAAVTAAAVVAATTTTTTTKTRSQQKMPMQIKQAQCAQAETMQTETNRTGKITLPVVAESKTCSKEAGMPTARRAAMIGVALEHRRASAQMLNGAIAAASGGDLSGAIAALQALVIGKYGSNWPAAHVNLANVLADAGRGQEAMQAYDRALALDSTCFEALANAGMLALELADATPPSLSGNATELREAASVHLRRATSLPAGAEWFDGWYALANTLSAIGLGYEEEALRCYDKAIACAKPPLENSGEWLVAALCNSGALLLNAGRLIDSVARCEEAVRTANNLITKTEQSIADSGSLRLIEVLKRRSEAMHNLAACLHARRASNDQSRALQLCHAAANDMERVVSMQTARVDTESQPAIIASKHVLAERLSQQALLLCDSESPALATRVLKRAELLLSTTENDLVETVPWAKLSAEARRLRLRRLFLLLRIGGAHLPKAHELLSATIDEVEAAAEAALGSESCTGLPEARDAALLNALMGQTERSRQWTARANDQESCLRADSVLTLSECCQQGFWLSALPKEGIEALTDKGRLSESCGVCVVGARGDATVAARNTTTPRAAVAPLTAVVHKPSELLPALTRLLAYCSGHHGDHEQSLDTSERYWFLKDCVVQRGQGVRIFKWPQDGRIDCAPPIAATLSSGKPHVLQPAVNPPALLRAQDGQLVKFGIRIHAMIVSAGAGLCRSSGAVAESEPRLYLFVFDEGLLTMCGKGPAQGYDSEDRGCSALEHIACTSVQRSVAGFKLFDVKGPASTMWDTARSTGESCVHGTYASSFCGIKHAVATAVIGARESLAAAITQTDAQNTIADTAVIGTLQFQILGLDFVADTDGRPFLLECNSSPQFMHPSTHFRRELAAPLLHGIPDVLCDVSDATTKVVDLSLKYAVHEDEAATIGRQWIYVPVDTVTVTE